MILKKQYTNPEFSIKKFSGFYVIRVKAKNNRYIPEESSSSNEAKDDLNVF